MRSNFRKHALGALVAFLLGATMPGLLSADDKTVILPEAMEGVHYGHKLQEKTGEAQLRWKFISGEMPPGVQLEPSGSLRGLPAHARLRPYNFVLEAHSESTQTFTQPFSLVVRSIFPSGQKLGYFDPGLALA
ncbi:MAG: hypothetical protein ACRD2R_01640, partial [Terriglobales bacterium]